MIIYSAIARASDGAILVDCSDPVLKGNAGVVSSLLFCHLRDNPEYIQEGEHQTLKQRNDGVDEEGQDLFSMFLGNLAMSMGEDLVDEHFFHLYYKNEVIYLCIGDDPDLMDQKVAFAYLDQIQQEFEGQFKAKKIRHAHAYSLEKSFRPNMRMAMHHFNVNHDKICQDEKTKKLLTQVQELSAVMGQNINVVLNRGEKLEDMLDRSDELTTDAKVFYKRSKSVKRAVRKKYLKRQVLQYALIGLGITLVVLFILFGVCGYGLSHCRANNNN